MVLRFIVTMGEEFSQSISGKKNLSILPRDDSCNILVKKVAAVCPCLKSVLEVTGFGLFLLAEEISKHPQIDSVI